MNIPLQRMEPIVLPVAGMRHSELAHKCFHQRRIKDAVSHFRLATECGEDPECAALERWLTMMTAGEFEEAWRESDRVLARRTAIGESCRQLPRHLRWVWDGSPLDGRDVLVRCYHGMGDVLQFIRYVPSLAEICGRVRVEAPPELMELLASVAGIDELSSLEDQDPPHDGEIELMEIPHALRATVETIPADVPYIKVEQSRVDAIRDSMHAEHRFRVGLVWASGMWRPERSVPLTCFSFLREMQEAAVIGLQRGSATREAAGEALPFVYTDWSNSSVTDTAAIIQNLDLVISTDTMVAHLAGALGAPVWTLLPFHSDWRWMTDREDSPWYPTMRLFRQPSSGSWDSVVGRVRSELEKLIYYQREGLRP